MADSRTNLDSALKLIKRRKRVDAFFGVLGAFLIVTALSVLGLLMASLIKDGGARLFASHEVREDGDAPGFRDSIGVLRKSGEQFELVSDIYILKPNAEEIDVTLLDGKRVAIEGTYPQPGRSEMSVDRVTALPDGLADADIPGDPVAIGKLDVIKSKEGKAISKLSLEPIVLTITEKADPSLNLSALEGKRVWVSGKRKFTAGHVTVPVVKAGKLEAKSFLASFPSKDFYRAGIFPAWVGSLLLMLVTMLIAVPLGIAGGIYLEEYAPKNRVTALIEINIANLAGVPSIIWGLLGLGLFVYTLNMERGILAGGMTLGLLVLPIVIIATRESIRAIPNIIREGSVALGATQWQTVRYHIIPYSMSGILTGSIIAMGRAIGETAPLICIGAVFFINSLPPAPISYTVPSQAEAQYEAAKVDNPNTPPPSKELDVQPLAWLNSKFTVVPIQIFDWVSRPEPEYHQNAAAASILLLIITLSLNGVAIYMRYRLRRKIKW